MTDSILQGEFQRFKIEKSGTGVPPVITRKMRVPHLDRMPDFFGRWMRAREIAHTKRDDNRVVRPFAWGLEFITDHVNGDDPRNVLREYSARAMARSEEFYELPEITDWHLDGDHLTWTSVVETPSIENNTVHARLFTPKRERKN